MTSVGGRRSAAASKNAVSVSARVLLDEAVLEVVMAVDEVVVQLGQMLRVGVGRLNGLHHCLLISRRRCGKRRLGEF